MHRVVILAFDGVIPFDLATPCEVFGHAALPDGSPGYEVRVCACEPAIDAGAFELRVRHGLSALNGAHTVIVPGIRAIDRPLPLPLLRAIKRAAARGARVASICTGAFVLAAAGLLAGKRATTHWLAASELQRRYPEVRVDPNVLYVDEGRLLTSAGAAAGLDLCFHLIRRDYGAAVAAAAARVSVMPLERAGGQAQFIVHAPPVVDGGSLEATLSWLEKNLSKPLSLASIARHAGLSVRSLSRRFREQAGVTPRQWLLRARVQRAQVLLETTRGSVEAIAERTGFGSASALRERFQRVLGTSPQAYRRAFVQRRAA